MFQIRVCFLAGGSPRSRVTSRAATLVGDTSGVSFPECVGHPGMATHIRWIDANGLSYLTFYGLVSEGSQKPRQVLTKQVG